MFKRRGTFLVLISLAMGIIAAWAANGWVRGRLLPADEGAENGDVVMAAAIDIPYGTKIEPRHIKALLLPAGTAPENAIRKADDVEGMVAKADVIRGEILMQNRFARHEEGSTLAALVQEDMRAVTVRVDDVVGVAGFLLPGNRVDVLASRLDQKTRRASTETILKNLKVLAVDQSASTDSNDPVIVRAVTLEMTPSQSEELVKAQEEGSIQLTLRNPLAQEPVVEAAPPPPPPPRAVARPAPRPRRPTETTITVIRGTQVDTTKSQN
jgi:pilus assembly protein CpaB